MNPPIGSGLPRIAAEDTELNGVFIPKGAKLSIDIYETHHSPRFWKDPEVFNPDRFADGGEASEKAAGSGYSWIPFGNGSRQCIGMNFSLVEQSVLLPLLRKSPMDIGYSCAYVDHVISSQEIWMVPARRFYPQGKANHQRHWIGDAQRPSNYIQKAFSC